MRTADFEHVFAAVPGNNILVMPNPPIFTIVAVSEGFLSVTGRNAAMLRGRGLFEAFPNNPADPERTSERRVMASLEQALAQKQDVVITMHRYDVSDTEGVFEERYWSSANRPVLNESGEVIYLIHSIEDITARVRMAQREQQIKGIEKAFTLFMQAPIIISLLKGPELIVELINNAALQLWNRTSDIIGKPLLEVIPELNNQGIAELLWQVRTTGRPYIATEERVVSLVEGREVVHYFDRIYQPYYDDNSTEATGVFTMSHDVTELVNARRAVEEAKREVDRQKRLYEAINGSTPDLIYVFDLNHNFIYVNEAILSMWGRTAEESIGKGLLQNGYEPWHAELHEREIDQVAATKMPVRGEVSFPHATLGKRIYDYIMVPVINENGVVEAVAGTTRDITDLKQAELNARESEQRFRHLADDSPIFVFLVENDDQASVSYWNKTWLQYTGLSGDEALGLAWASVLHPDDIAVAMDCYLPAFEEKKAYLIPAIRVRRHDGVYRWHAFKGSPRYLPNGTFNGYVGVGFDIHEQKLAEEVVRQNEALLQRKVAERTAELQLAVDELKRVNANLEEFAYAASHDMKEPIRKIHFFADRLKTELGNNLTESQHRLFSRLEHAASRMGSLIDDLLTYSQTTQGVGELETIDLNKKVAAVLEDLDLEIQQSGAKVQVDQLPKINGDRRQFQQLFQNLIGNAIKYRKPDVPPEIKITYREVTGAAIEHLPVDPEQRFYLLQIRDNGIGFEQKDAERIFNVFTRLHGNAEFRGTGVGLSIVRKVVEHHKGHIWAESAPGAGATFNLLLPVS